MRLSTERIKSLQLLLKELGLDCTDEQAQEAGLTIMRFVLANAQQASDLSNNGDKKNE
jgi:hypothetical protein